MQPRRISAQRFSLGMTLALISAQFGCYASHGRPVAADGGSGPDALIRSDVPVGADTPLDAGSCTPRGQGLLVRIEPVTIEAAACNMNHVEGMQVSSIEPELAANGVRIHADFCPGRDLDCRCDLILGNIGADVMPTELLGNELTLDMNPGEGLGAFVSIREAPHCRCDGCSCSLELVLYAADTTPEEAPFLPIELAFARGAEICPDMGCVSGVWALGVSAMGERFDLFEGATHTTGAVRVRGLRDVDVLGPCAACGMCGTLHGSWVAWAE